MAVVLIEESDQSQGGRRCRVLGKAGLEMVVRLSTSGYFKTYSGTVGRDDHDEEVRQLSRALLIECERAKVRLSDRERADVTVMNPNTGAVLSAELLRRALKIYSTIMKHSTK